MKTSDLLAWIALVWSILVWICLTVVAMSFGLFSLADRFNGNHNAPLLGLGGTLFVLEALLIFLILKRSKAWAAYSMFVWILASGFAMSFGDLRAYPMCLVWVSAVMAPVVFLAFALIFERKRTNSDSPD